MSSHSLRKGVLHTIQSNHPALIADRYSWFTKIILSLTQKNSWWKVILMVIAILTIGTWFPVKFFQVISFKPVTPSLLIDQRATNLATIISMTIAVIGFLLSNLSIKEPQTYKLLFERSKLYFIIYYSLTVIGSLILISTLRDTLPGDLFPKLVLMGTYMAVSVLFCIGYLFKTIISFASASIIQQELVRVAKIEAKNKIYIQLISAYGAKQLGDWMNDRQLIASSPGIEQLVGQSSLNGLERPDLLYDINLEKLGQHLATAKTGAQKYYRTAYTLNVLIPDPGLFIYPVTGTASKKAVPLRNCFTLKATNRLMEEKGDFVRYFARKLEEYSEAGNAKKLSEVLDLFAEIYDLEMKNQPV